MTAKPMSPKAIPRVILDPRGVAPRIANLGVYAWHMIDALREKSRMPFAARVPERATRPR